MREVTKGGKEGQLSGYLCGKKGELCSPGNLGPKELCICVSTQICLLPEALPSEYQLEHSESGEKSTGMNEVSHLKSQNKAERYQVFLPSIKSCWENTD